MLFNETAESRGVKPGRVVSLLMGADEVKGLIPHLYPFLFIDGVLDLDPGRRITAVKRFDPGEEFFKGHFPGNPVVPGVIIVEAIAQAGGILIARSYADRLRDASPALVGLDKVKFRRPVRPGDEVRFDVEVIRGRDRLWRLRGEAYVDGKKVAEAQITASLF